MSQPDKRNVTTVGMSQGLRTAVDHYKEHEPSKTEQKEEENQAMRIPIRLEKKWDMWAPLPLQH